MDYALNNLQRLICYKTQTNKHLHIYMSVLYDRIFKVDFQERTVLFI